MAAYIKKHTKRADKSISATLPKGRGDDSRASHYFETSQVVETGLFFIFAALVTIISFLGQQPKGPQLLLNQPAPSRVVAEFPFDFHSEILLEKEIKAIETQVPPVFQRTLQPYEQFRKFIGELQDRITKTRIDFEDEGDETVQAELEKTINALASESELEVAPASIIKLLSTLTNKQRAILLNDALSVLHDLYRDGIYTTQRNNDKLPQITVIQLIDESGSNNLPEARSLDKATVALRRHLDALSEDEETARAIFDIFRSGIQPNLVYSESGTKRAIQLAVSKIEPPITRYEEGDTLIVPGAIVNQVTLERMKAYNQASLANGGDATFLNILFAKRMILTAILLIGVYLYIKQGLRDIHKRNRAITVTAVSILLNLLIIRLVMEVGEIAAATNRPLLSMLPFITPYALAPIMVAVLVGVSPAVLSALIVAVIFGIIQNNSIEFMLIAFLSGIVGSFASNHIRKRSMLVRAGLFAGIAAALAGTAIGLLNNFSAGLIGQQILIALIVGGLTGILAAGLLPVLEHIFKVTTDITLLELTDFNHPLLRRMQMEAPGTYHHSLMVANLSENAAATIGASPLLCRVCCLFHDIGKLVKPEYFAENQRGGINPHDEKNPSMSALVIKAHVKEGVEMARKNKLPRVIIDVIRQHHGTSLIQYFYYQAQQRQKDQAISPATEKGSKKAETTTVDQSTYRYDGPRPAFKESAIIFFADGVEAASRSLKKVTQPSVEELIDNIFKDRIEDGQLDDCPLTFHELQEIRNSFVYTLLNMLHSRVEYPKENTKEPETAVSEETGHATASTGNQQPV